MAGFTLGSAIVRILGDDEELKKSLSTAKASVGTFASNAGDKIRSVFGGALKVAGVALVGTVLAVGTAMLSTEKQFQDSTNKIQSALGLTEAEAIGVGNSMRDVWANNFGDSVQDVEQSIIAVETAMQRIGGVSNEQLTASTEDAFRLRDAYGIEVAESVGTVTTLMDTMGLSADQAYDFVTSGIQNGLNSNGDFLESIGEYSGLFAEAGFSADEMYAIMQSGAQGGVLGTDKVADAIKEMNIILNEGGEEVSNTFADMGMSYEGMAANVSAGKATWADYFPAILEGLQGIEDPIARNLAQTEIFGTMAEDLGVSFTDSLSTMGTKLEDMSGATDTLDSQYQTWGTTLEGWKRTAIDAMEPLSSTLLEMANDAMPDIQAAFEGFIEKLIEWTPDIIDFVESFVSFIIDHGDTILTTLGAMAVAFGILAIATSPVTLIILAVGAAVAGLSIIWSENWGDIQGKTETVVNFIKELVGNFVERVEQFWADHGDAIIATVEGFVESIKTGISNFMDTVEQFWADHGETIKDTVSGFIDLVIGYFEGLWEGITLAWEGFRAAFEGDWETFGENLALAAGAVIEAIVEFWGGLWDLVSPLLDTAMTNMQAAFTDVDWAAIGDGIITGVKNGIEAAKEALFGTMRGIAKGALEAAKGILQINSPSQVFADQVGEPIVQGVEKPILDGRGRVVDAIEQLVAIPNSLAGGGGSSNSVTNNNSFGGDVFNLVTNSPAGVANFVSRNRRARLEGVLGY